MGSLRVRTSRRLSRLFLGSDAMICAHLHWRQHWAEPAVDAAFWLLRGELKHCSGAASYEARQTRELDTLDAWRRQGLL